MKEVKIVSILPCMTAVCGKLATSCVLGLEAIVSTVPTVRNSTIESLEQDLESTCKNRKCEDNVQALYF